MVAYWKALPGREVAGWVNAGTAAAATRVVKKAVAGRESGRESGMEQVREATDSEQVSQGSQLLLATLAALVMRLAVLVG